MAADIEGIVQKVSNLVSPPAVWIRINEVVEDPAATAADLARVITKDPSLAAKLLKVVNSPFYNFRTRVDSISRAVTLLGINEVHSLATAITAASVFHRIPNNLVRPDTFWRHSIGCAIAARMAARRCGVLHPERLYVAGMLHDIGSPVLYQQFPDKATEALMAAGGDEDVLVAVEQELFGFDHAALGAALLHLWRLPDTLIESVAWHHDPQRAEHAALDASILHLANVAANRLAGSSFVEGQPRTELAPDPLVWPITGLTEEFLDEAGATIEEELQQAIALFLP